jgi:hypothetical protein
MYDMFGNIVGSETLLIIETTSGIFYESLQSVRDV